MDYIHINHGLYHLGTDRSTSWWINQTRWSPQPDPPTPWEAASASTWCFPIKPVKGFVRGIRVLEGMVSAANYLYVNGTSPHSLFCVLCCCLYGCVSVCTRHQGGVLGGREGVSQNDMYAGDSHLFWGSFQTVETMLLHFCHNRACVMCYLPCRPRISQMEIRVRKLPLTTQLQRLMVKLTPVGSSGNTEPITFPRWH